MQLCGSLPLESLKSPFAGIAKSANAENLHSVRIRSKVYHLHSQSARDINFELAKILCVEVWAKTLRSVVPCLVHPQYRSYSGGCGKNRFSEMPVAEVCNERLKKVKRDCSMVQYCCKHLVELNDIETENLVDSKSGEG